MTTYCFDSDALITPWRFYYSEALAPSYWNCLAELAKQKVFFCPEEIYKEITTSEDGLSGWLKDISFVVQKPNEAVQEKMIEIMQQFPTGFVDVKKSKSGGDPWVIAHAWHENAIVVTKERPKQNQPNSKKYNIPDVCEHFNIPWIDDFEFLKRLKVQFEASCSK